METYLQFGWGMMSLAHELISSWGGGTVILSPRDLKANQLEKFAGRINDLPNGSVLVDPQTYMPNADHDRLVAHDYWITDYVTGNAFSGPQLATLLGSLKELNASLDTTAAILPGILAAQVTPDWLDAERMIFEEASALGFGRPLIKTIALSADACRDADQIASLMEYLSNHPAPGYYVVCEHPQGNYLVDDVAWVANLLDIVAGLKLLDSKVIVGYSSHQSLILGTAKADAIATGTWMNLRAFPPEKFAKAFEDEIKLRSTWYYATPTLSEYKLSTLDGAYLLGLLGQLASPGAEAEIAALFDGVQPTTLGLAERGAFAHYLNMLRNQAAQAIKLSFDETLHSYHAMLDAAEGTMTALAGSRITGQMRDFSICLEANRLAAQVLEANRGPMLRHHWNTL